MSIRCNGLGARIDITSAMYGRQGKKHCWRFYGHVWNTKCKSSKSKSEVRKACQGKSNCQIYAKNSVFGDPCFMTEKYLQVKYQCRGKIAYIKKQYLNILKQDISLKHSRRITLCELFDKFPGPHDIDYFILEIFEMNFDRKVLLLLFSRDQYQDQDCLPCTNFIFTVKFF